MQEYTLSKPTIERLAFQSRSNAIVDSMKRRAVPSVPSWPGVYGAVAASEFEAASIDGEEATPGIGTATIFKTLDDTGFEISDVVCVSYSAESIEVGTQGVVIQEIFGRFLFVPIAAGSGAGPTMKTFELEADVPYDYDQDVAADVGTLRSQGPSRAKTGAIGISGRVGSIETILAVQSPALLIKATIALTDGGSPSLNYAARWDEAECKIANPVALTEFPFNWIPPGLETISNRFGLNGEVGDDCLVAYDQAADEYFLAKVYHSTPLGLGFRLPSPYTPTASWSGPIDAEGVWPLEGGEVAATIAIHDPYRRLVGAKASASGFAVWNQELKRLDVLGCSAGATRIYGTAVADFAATDTTFALENLSGGDGPIVGSKTIANLFGWEGKAGQAFKADWNEALQRWEPVAGDIQATAAPARLQAFELEADVPFGYDQDVEADVGTLRSQGPSRAKSGAIGISGRVGSIETILAVQSPALWIKATIALTDGGSPSLNYAARWDEAECKIANPVALTEFPFNWIPPGLETISNRFGLNGEVGDDCLVAYDQAADEYFLVKVYHSTPLGLGFRLPSPYTPTASWSGPIDAEGVWPLEGGEVAATIAIHDPYRRLVGAKASASGFAVWNQALKRLEVLGCSAGATRIYGTAVADFAAADTTFSLENLSGGDGPIVGSKTIANLFGWEGSEGQAFKADWNEAEQRWEPVAGNVPSSSGGGGGAAFAYAVFQRGSGSGYTVLAQVGGRIAVGAAISPTFLGDYMVPPTGKGIAIWGLDGSTEIWLAVEVQTQPIRCKAVLGQFGSSPTGMRRTDATWPVESIEPLWPFPFDLALGDIDAENPYGLQGAIGEPCWICFDLALETWVIESVFSSFPTAYQFSLTGAMPTTYNASYTIARTVLFGDRGSQTPTNAQIPLHDPYFHCVLGQPGDTGLAVLIDDHYEVTSFTKRATRVRGLVAADFDASDATFVLETLSGLNGLPPSTLTITVQNVHEWEGVAELWVRAEWNQTAGQWEAYQMDCNDPAPPPSGGGGGGNNPGEPL